MFDFKSVCLKKMLGLYVYPGVRHKILSLHTINAASFISGISKRIDNNHKNCSILYHFPNSSSSSSSPFSSSHSICGSFSVYFKL